MYTTKLESCLSLNDSFVAAIDLMKKNLVSGAAWDKGQKHVGCAEYLKQNGNIVEDIFFNAIT